MSASRSGQDDAAAPTRSGGLLVSQAQQLGGRVFSRILKEHGIDELNPAQGRIVFSLWQEDGLAQNELARRVKLDKSGLALMLDRLEERGQIERKPDPSDARKKRVYLTAANRRLHAEYAKASAEMNALYYRGLSESEIDGFEASLAAIVANLESALAEREAE
jgi:MarR family transcriptional regulator, organic hydroperoxide resistance regulator